MSVLVIVGWSAVGVLVAAWLFVTFGLAGPRRPLVAWLGATALYVALLSLFVNLLLRAREADSTLGLVAFGFLAAFFSTGLLLSLRRTVAELRGGKNPAQSTTN